MTLPAARTRDAQALAVLHALAFEAPWSATEIADLLATPGVFALAAWDTDGPAGFILCRTMADEAEILTLAVAPTRRRRGVARDLLDGATWTARSRGASALFLEVAAANVAAVALYEGAGFNRLSVRPRYYVAANGAVDAWVFRRGLTPTAP